MLLDFVAKEKDRLAAAPEKLKLLTGSKGEPSAEQGGWTAAARVLLNLDETITKE